MQWLLLYLLQSLVGMLEVSVQWSSSLAAPNWQQGPQVLFLTTMAVRNLKRKQGIGAALLRAAEDWSATAHLSVSHAALLVHRNNDAAVRYFTDFARLPHDCEPINLCVFA